jgi:hypothetical protein
MNYGDWKKEYKPAKKVAETKVKSAQPNTSFYFLTFKESYRQVLRHEATIEVSSSQNAKNYKQEFIVVKFKNVDAFYILNKHLRRIISVEIHPTIGLTHINLVNNSTSCQKLCNLFKNWVNSSSARSELFIVKSFSMCSLLNICFGQATESFIDLESSSELSVQKASPVPLTEELWLNSFKTLLELHTTYDSDRLPSQSEKWKSNSLATLPELAEKLDLEPNKLVDIWQSVIPTVG